jgi:ribosomal protein S27AE
MAIEVESIVVTCPKCGEEYATWMGVGLEGLGPDSCPRCGFTPSEDPRLHRDGLADIADEDEPGLPV